MALSFNSTAASVAASQYTTAVGRVPKLAPFDSGLIHLHFPHRPTTPNLSRSSASADKFWRTNVSFFQVPAFFSKGKDAKISKEELLEAIAPLDRGADATPEDQQRVDQIARKLEAVNPTKEPLKSDLLNGKWELIYTTSKSILQTQTKVPQIDCKLSRNQCGYTSSPKYGVLALLQPDLAPLSARKVAVKFDYFKIAGLIPVKAPETARGELDITYLDEDLRISRGDKGNLFILKMVDPSYRVPL